MKMDMEEMSVLIDLKKPSTAKLRDKYSIWEYGLAFKRTMFLAFKNSVLAAHEEDGEEGFITIDTLSKHLHTEAWKELRDPSSELCKVLSHEVFWNHKRQKIEG